MKENLNMPTKVLDVEGNGLEITSDTVLETETIDNLQEMGSRF